MMNYDFDEPIPRRGTHSLKWDEKPADDILPMWVADMDFRTAPAVVEALRRRVEHGIFGYAKVPESYYAAITGWFARRHGWAPAREWIRPVTGVIPALSAILRALTRPGDKVLMQTPVYNHFFISVANSGCAAAECELTCRDNTYTIDFDALERTAADPAVKLMILCNPHNPAGRVWTPEELRRIGEICLRNDVFVVADEIHCELIMPGFRHTPFASLSDEFARRSVTCTSPSKAFNLAGLQVANIFAADAAIRERIGQALALNETGEISPFAIEALTAAYDEGVRSFWLNAFSSPWTPWEKIALKFLQAKDDPQKLKVVYNTLLGELWEDRGDIADEDTMLARREDYGTNADGSPVEVPEGVLVLTCGVDTQDNRLEYEVVGHGFYGETWGIKKGYIMGKPDTDEVWQQLDDVIDHVYRFKDGKGLRISITCVDSGGHYTQEVYTRCRERKNKRVFAIKGKGGDGIPFVTPPSKVPIKDNKRITCWLYTLGVDAGKETIMSSLKVQEAGPKYCHFPIHESCGYDTYYFNGLLSERLELTQTKRGNQWHWVKIPGHNRNEALDCRNYANAGLKIIDPDMFAVERRLKNIQEAPQTKPAQRRKPKPAARNYFDEW